MSGWLNVSNHYVRYSIEFQIPMNNDLSEGNRTEKSAPDSKISFENNLKLVQLFYVSSFLCVCDGVNDEVQTKWVINTVGK